MRWWSLLGGLSLLVAARPASALFHASVIDEVMAGKGSDATIQFVEIRMLAGLQNFVTDSVLASWSCDGSTKQNLLVVPADVANAGSGVRWLMASPNGSQFLAAFAVTPDFTFTGTIPAACGQICWGAPVAGNFKPVTPVDSWDHTNPDNYVDCVEWGAYTGPTKSGALPSTGTPGDGAHSLQRGMSSWATADPTPQANSAVVTTTTTSATATTGSTTSTTLGAPVGQPLTGARLVLKTNAKKQTGNLSALSKDGTLALGGDGTAADPTVSGAVAYFADSGLPSFVQLPAANWSKASKKKANKGYRYKDPSRSASTITAISLKPGPKGLLSLVRRSEPFSLAGATAPGPLGVGLVIGPKAYCLSFGGTVKFKTGKSLVAKNAPAGTCPDFTTLPSVR